MSIATDDHHQNGTGAGGVFATSLWDVSLHIVVGTGIQGPSDGRTTPCRVVPIHRRSVSTVRRVDNSCKTTTVGVYVGTNAAHREQVADLVFVRLGDGERAAVVVALAVGEDFELVAHVVCGSGVARSMIYARRLRGA